MDLRRENASTHYWSRSAILIAAGAFCALLVFGEYFCRVEAARERAVVQNRTLIAAASIRSKLEADLSSTLYLGIGLSGYLSLNPTLNPTIVEPLLATIQSHGKFVRNIGLAPNNRLDYIYPREGNEKAIGIEFESIPSQWPAVKLAMDTGETVVVGPVDLVQGGIGLITRTPVYLQDGTYWGLISIVVDIEALLESRRRESRQIFNTEWAMRTQTERTDAPPYILGNKNLFDDATAIHTFDIPGATWEIAVKPHASWAYDGRRIHALRAAAFLLASLISLLVFLTLNERGEIKHLSLHDALTGLANRRLLLERIEQCMALADRHKTGFCVLFLDLNKFKPVNDLFGHQAGDHVLREIAKRLKAALRESDTVARVGGDEFIILLPETDSKEDAMTVATNMANVVALPMDFKSHAINIGVSIGVGHYPEDGATAHALIEHSDKAMYRAKTTG